MHLPQSIFRSLGLISQCCFCISHWEIQEQYIVMGYVAPPLGRMNIRPDNNCRQAPMANVTCMRFPCSHILHGHSSLLIWMGRWEAKGNGPWAFSKTSTAQKLHAAVHIQVTAQQFPMHGCYWELMTSRCLCSVFLPQVQQRCAIFTHSPIHRCEPGLRQPLQPFYIGGNFENILRYWGTL